MRFAIREGGRTIGAGVVSRILAWVSIPPNLIPGLYYGLSLFFDTFDLLFENSIRQNNFIVISYAFQKYIRFILSMSKH